MSITSQCQKPEPVGASGSKHVTAKLLVSAGKPDQRIGGDVPAGHAPVVEDLILAHLLPVGDVIAGHVERGHLGHKVIGQRRTVGHD
jgi:hypothetical protein